MDAGPAGGRNYFHGSGLARKIFRINWIKKVKDVDIILNIS